MLCVWQGGLWRLTGQQIAGAAAEVEAGATPASGKGGTEGASEDVRGPHAALAVKLQVTDPQNVLRPCTCIPVLCHRANGVVLRAMFSLDPKRKIMT